MSEVDLNPFSARALETLIESETSTRVALSRLEFHYFSEFGIERQKRIREIEALMRTVESDELEKQTNEDKPKEVERIRFSDKDSEERWLIEEEEHIGGRLTVELQEAEDWERLCIAALGMECSLVINEAFKPCISLMYYYPWDVNDFRLLPIKPNALDRVKHPERHIPKYMRRDQFLQRPGVRAFLLEEHEGAYQETIAALEGPPPPLQLTEG